MKAKNALSLVLAAGVVAPAFASTPETLTSVMPTEKVAHIYFNIATGEKVATLLGDGTATRGIGDAIWIVDNGLPCADFGQTQGTAGIQDDPFGLFYTSAPTKQTWLDWGDIPGDSVVDAVTVTWATQHQDTDTDSDSIGDGVEGFGAFWSWYDGDNGFNTCFTRTGLVGFTLFNLPGVVGPVDPNLLAVYTATVDLASSFTTSISFEIADSDGDPQGAAVHNPFFASGDLDSDTIPDGDLDGDGLADFAYAMMYIQPGTVDFDSDTLPDGDPATAALTAQSLAAPTGPAVFDGTDWSIDPVAPLPAGQGLEDAFDIYTDINSDGFFESVGTFFFGGFTCQPYNPYSQFDHTLHGPGGATVCRADLFPAGAPDGILNFFDVSTFLSLFNAQDPIADFFPVGAPDGVWNFFDVSTFLSEFNAGCPL